MRRGASTTTQSAGPIQQKTTTSSHPVPTDAPDRQESQGRLLLSFPNSPLADLEVTRIVAVSAEQFAGVLHLDLLEDGTYQLTYNERYVPDIQHLQSVLIQHIEK